MSFKVVIPARYASERLPGKPLLDIAGKPMVIRVAEKSQESGAEQTVIATDFKKIMDIAKAHKVQAMMTKVDHISGTDRIAEVVDKMQWDDDDIVVNVQGDEPLIKPTLIQEVALSLAHHQKAVMATACHPIHDEAMMLNPNVVKVVMDAQKNALYFSRSPIPYPRDDIDKQNIQAHRHIGIYAYRVAFLKQYAGLDMSELEKIEKLEQLRVLYHGFKIVVTITDHAPERGVDTQQDLDYIRDMFKD